MAPSLPSRRGLAAAVLGSAAALALALAPGNAAATGPGFASAVKLAGGCGGEPSIDLDGKGHVYVSAPKGIFNVAGSCQGLPGSSTNGAATWVSNDGGRSFGAMISAGTLLGGGDTDTTVDPHTGDVYVADLEAVAADICVSHDHGQSYVTAVTGQESCTTPFNFTGQAGPSNDREWLTSYGPTSSYPHHDLYLTYHDFATNLPEIWISQDGGPFIPSMFPGISNPSFAQQALNGTLIAKPVLDSAGTIYELVTTLSSESSGLDELWSVVSTDHGQTFTATQIFDGAAANANMGLVFNDLAIDGAGNLYALVLGNAAGTIPPAHAYLFTSTDKGASWHQHLIPTDGKALALPALHGGPQAGQLVLGYYHSTTTTDPNDLAGQWKYQALESTDADSTSPSFTAVDLGSTSNPGTGVVHQGQICTAGINCTTGQIPGVNPAGEGNRNLADFSSVTVDQNGCAVFTYADDGAIKADQSNFDFSLISNDVTRQTTGCFATAAAVSTPTPTATPVAATAPTSTLPNSSAAAPSGSAAALLAGAGLLAATAWGARRRRRHTPRP